MKQDQVLFTNYLLLQYKLGAVFAMMNRIHQSDSAVFGQPAVYNIFCHELFDHSF